MPSHYIEMSDIKKEYRKKKTSKFISKLKAKAIKTKDTTKIVLSKAKEKGQRFVAATERGLVKTRSGIARVQKVAQKVEARRKKTFKGFSSNGDMFKLGSGDMFSSSGRSPKKGKKKRRTNDLFGGL